MKMSKEFLDGYETGYDNAKYETVQSLLKLDLLKPDYHIRHIKSEIDNQLNNENMINEDFMVSIILEIIEKQKNEK